MNNSTYSKNLNYTSELYHIFFLTNNGDINKNLFNSCNLKLKQTIIIENVKTENFSSNLYFFYYNLKYFLFYDKTEINKNIKNFLSKNNNIKTSLLIKFIHINDISYLNTDSFRLQTLIAVRKNLQDELV